MCGMDKTLSIHDVSHDQVEIDQLPILKYETLFHKTQHYSSHRESNCLSTSTLNSDYKKSP